MNKPNIKNFSIRKFDISSFNVKFVSKYRIWFSVPLVCILVAIIAFSIFAAVGNDAEEGMNLGIDFTGGTVMTINVGSELDSEYGDYSKEIRNLVKAEGFDVGYIQKSGTGEDSSIIVKYQNGNGNIEESNQSLKDAIAARYSNITVDDISMESISASSAKDLLEKALISLAVIFAVMLVYIGIRFEFWSGISALIALVHDVLMMIAFTILFHIEVNTTYVAAVITIVAYSINNTIIVFDRVREMVRSAGSNKYDLTSYVEEAVNDTFSRSTISTITTMIPVFLLGCFGVASLKEFAWPIMFGLIAGTYSSLILAPTIYVLIRNSIIKSKTKKYAAVNGAATDKPAKKTKVSKTSAKTADALTDALRNRTRNK